MRKRDLMRELERFDDDDQLTIGEMAVPYVPLITTVCGKGQKHLPYYCVRDVGHVGECFCRNKGVSFIPDNVR